VRILVVGATGFIGRHVAAHLRARGHDVVGTSRRRREAFCRYPQYGWIVADLHSDLEARIWRAKLHGFDAVVNCAGLYREAPGETFETVHALGPLALFRACAEAKLARVVQLTPLGDASASRSHLLASRRYAERHLESLDLDWVVLAHPLLLGEGSPAAAALAAHPPRTPSAALMPLSIDDLCAAVACALESPEAVRRRFSLAGAERFAPRELARALRPPRMLETAGRLLRHLVAGKRRRTEDPGVALLAVSRTPCGGFREITGRLPGAALPEAARLVLLYDGACPICVFEMDRLKGLDRARRLAYLDIAAPDFDPGRYGVTMAALMGRMHAVSPERGLLVGMEAIRAAYAAVGFGWLLAITGLPLLRPLCDRLYLAFARHRYAISRWLGMRCDSGACRTG
jgi:uncharacterized protein YbjT (DUF2867 family)/predicted DCC family thiol-disulfide oxidoreductase YuxK